MFGTQAMRLLREKWANATLLAEELYAMFQDDIPLTQNAPVTINNFGSAQPALTLDSNQNPFNPAPLQLRGSDGTTSTVDVHDGNITFTNGVTGQEQQQQEQQKPKRTAFVGVVLSGSGNTYSVRLDTNVVVSAFVPGGISGSSTVPAGAAFPVIKLDNNTYQMPVPLWYA